MGEYDSSIALADRLITKKGLRVHIERHIPYSRTEVSAVRIPTKYERKSSEDIQRIDAHLLLPASQIPFELDKTMNVIIEGNTYGIKELEPLRPNEQTIIWKVWLNG